MSDRMDELLGELDASTRATPGDVQRLRAGLALHIERAARPARRPRRWWPGAVGLGASVLAAAAALALFVRPPPAVPLQQELGGGGPGEVVSLDGVVLTLDGAGQLGGTTASPEITWERGLVHVDVTPGALEGFTATTPEGIVVVKGTVFDVVRDARGLGVAVERGEVAVTCIGGVATPVGAGERHECLPTSAGALLGRAQALRDAGETEDRVLDALDRAQALGPSGVLGQEVGAQRAVSLQALGRGAEALEQVERALADGGGPRATELHRLAAELAAVEGDCLRAGPHAAAVEAAGEALGPEAVARCTSR